MGVGGSGACCSLAMDCRYEVAGACAVSARQRRHELRRVHTSMVGTTCRKWIDTGWDCQDTQPWSHLTEVAKALLLICERVIVAIWVGPWSMTAMALHAAI